jgi:cyclophilin family peptidyl-prolyl cis-trans isomerase
LAVHASCLFRQGFIAQWGYAATPALSAKWNINLLDEPVLHSNTVGTLSYATSGPNTRSTQVFVNLHDNGRLDRQGFSPFVRGIVALFDQRLSLLCHNFVPCL